MRKILETKITFNNLRFNSLTIPLMQLNFIFYFKLISLFEQGITSYLKIIYVWCFHYPEAGTEIWKLYKGTG